MRIGWPTAVVLSVVVAALAAVVLAGPALGLPAEARDEVLAWVGGIGALALGVLGPLLRRDDNRNGIPDVLEGDSGGES